MGWKYWKDYHVNKCREGKWEECECSSVLTYIKKWINKLLGLSFFLDENSILLHTSNEKVMTLQQWSCSYIQ